MPIFEKFKRAVFYLAHIFEYIGWFILLGWVGLMFLGTIARYVFRSPFLFQVDLVSVALVVFCTFCFSAIFLADEHIRVDLFTRLLPRRIQEILWLFSEGVFFGFSILIIYSSLGLISHALKVDSRMDVSNIPTAPFLLCIPVGFGILALVIITDFCDRLLQMKKRGTDSDQNAI